MSGSPYRRLGYVLLPYEFRDAGFKRFFMVYYGQAFSDARVVPRYSSDDNGIVYFMVFDGGTLEEMVSLVESRIEKVYAEYVRARDIARAVDLYNRSRRLGLDLDIPGVFEGV